MEPVPEPSSVLLIDLMLMRDNSKIAVLFRSHGPIDSDDVLHVENERVV